MSELFKILGIDVVPYFLDKGYVSLIDVDDEVLCLVREEVLNYVEDGSVLVARNSDEKDNARSVVVEAELAGLNENVARKNVTS